MSLNVRFMFASITLEYVVYVVVGMQHTVRGSD